MQIASLPAGRCCAIRTGHQEHDEALVASSLCALCLTHPVFQHVSQQRQQAKTTTLSPPSPSCVSQANIAIDTDTAQSKPPLQLPFAVPAFSPESTQRGLTPRQKHETSCALQESPFPHAEPVTPVPSSTTLKSALRRCPKSCCPKSATPRRVRGLWNSHCHCLFSQLHDDLLLFILSHLDMVEMLVCARVCRRWRYCANHDHSWKHVHATNFCTMNQSFPLQTSTVLKKHLTRHAGSLESLTIQGIQHGLLPDVFLPSMASMRNLCRLKLTCYASLTDTHVHVMLLTCQVNLPTFKNSNTPLSTMSAKSSLTSLALEQCPLLSNKTVKYIAMHCPHIQELSLRGNHNITSLAPLEECWQHDKKSRVSPSTVASLDFLFFAPPKANKVTPLKRQGRLTKLDISQTGVNVYGLCQAITGGRSIQLTRLKMSGSGESWTDLTTNKIGKCIDMRHLTTFDISCANIFGGSNLLTDAGLERLFEKEPLALKRVNLSGHAGITARGIARMITLAPHLVDLELNGGKGLIRHVDVDGMNALNGALSRHGSNASGGTGLQRLSLWRCFPNRRQSLQDVAEANHAASCGDGLIEALCHGPSAKVLIEIDVEGCYFVSKHHVDMLLRHCPRLTDECIKRNGTRSREEDKQGV